MKHDPQYLASCHGHIGNLCLKLNDYIKALDHYQKSLKLKLESLPENQLSIALTYVYLGRLYDERLNEYTMALITTKNHLKSD
ncbi:unnamed protein product [Didymodactylos carnosus]|uniref:Uncharacterized protein n=1 Tax=Didymodactylos carnosus TaxID=1234261 RepID=A0A814Q5J8_9BILA|nr:unnamed protein product [Didymodactylos carnosus]CAF1418963.1 unnamed protein product [Didymodactylos carnosus]CAF3878797.1 unnamed protein product [Didymodactylos carnosus]CAF4220357.1 unnamed protein product [Didymodactylos carnosus]